MEHLYKNTRIVLHLLLLLFSSAAMADDMDYMKLLESEATTTRIDRGEKSTQTPTTVISATGAETAGIVTGKWQGYCVYTNDDVPSDLDTEEFSAYLKQCARGTFVFYQRLVGKLKTAVYVNYKHSSPVKLTTLREDILKHF